MARARPPAGVSTVIIGTAGHVDHGKTTLVRALTGVDTDRLPEEKRRGMTIELGFAPLLLEGIGTVGLIDVPGHDAFVRTMVAGASGIDVALLVIAADEGIMPQTREHIAVLDLLGVRRAIVALSKCDLVDDEWRGVVLDDVREFLSATPLAGADCVPVSAQTGEGLAALLAAVAGAMRGVPARADDDLLRMPIDRVFTMRGIGTVVTGTVWSGQIAEGDVVTLYPSGKRVRVRALETHGAAVARAGAGTRTAVALAGVTRDDAGRGGVLVRGDAWTPSMSMRADISLLPDAAALSPRTRLRVHIGTADVEARVVCDQHRLEAGETRAARLALASPIVARTGDRFVIRRASPPSTIGGGVITDPIVRERRARAFPRAGISNTQRLTLIAAEAALRGVPAAELRVRIAGTSARSDAVLNEAFKAGALVRVGNRCFGANVLDAAGARVLTALEEYHRENPAETGAPIETMRARVRGATEVADHILESLQARGFVDRVAAFVRLSGFRPRVRPEVRVLHERVLARLSETGACPPQAGELVREFGTGVPRILNDLERAGLVVSLADGMFATTAAVSALRERVFAGIDETKSYRPTDLRDIFGMSRRHLLPWLEYFDRAGFSRREGDLRRFRR